MILSFTFSLFIPIKYHWLCCSGSLAFSLQLPRTIVNVLEILEIQGLRRIKRDTIGCNVLQKYAHQSTRAKSVRHAAQPPGPRRLWIISTALDLLPITFLFLPWNFRFVCPCFLLSGENSQELAEVKRINRQLQVRTLKTLFACSCSSSGGCVYVLTCF